MIYGYFLRIPSRTYYPCGHQKCNSEHFKGKISKGNMSKGNISKYAFHMFRELVYLSSKWPYVPPGNTFDMN